MPKTSFEFEVSTDKPKAIVIGPDYLTKPIASLFRQKGLSVHTNLTGYPTEPVDYIVDIQGNKKLINLAVETGAKYLRLILGKENFSFQDNLNWRVLKTDFIVGPNLPENSLMGKLIKSAIKNQPLTFPEKKQTLFPIHVKDLAKACWQTLIIPNTSKKEFLCLGKPVTSQRLGDYLQNLGQTTKETEYNPNISVRNYDSEEVESNYQNLNWQPNFEWQEAIKKSFQSMWSQESQKIDQQPAETSLSQKYVTESEPKTKSEPEPVPEPKKTTTYPQANKTETPQESEEEVIVIEEMAEEGKEDKDETKDQTKEVEKIVNQFKTQKIGKGNLSWWQPVILVLVLGLGFVFSIWLKPTLRLGLGFLQMKKAYSSIIDQNWKQGLETSQKAKENFLYAEHFLKNSRFSSLFLGYQNLFAKTSELGRKTASTSETAIPFFQNSLQLSESILKNKDFNQQKGINQIQTYQKNLDHQLKEIQALLKGSWPGIPGRWQNTPQKMAKKIDTALVKLDDLNQVLPHLPWLIGLDNQRRTYLVLLQNNMELRPTGGFIGSFAMLTFENGELHDFQVQDVYTADGQLKGHVEPPKQIKEILGEANWYLRDSNWSPDFPQSAQSAEWFLDKELNRKVDGVIGINLEAVKKLIAAFGEIYLADFNEKISADNIFERAEFWSENESFPGSNQKSAFLGLMGQQLFENIKAAQAEEYSKIGQSFMEALEEKEVLVYTHNDQLNSTLRELNWDGRIRNPQCSLENCFTDYIHLNEANLGVNKANYFLRRTIEQGVSIQNNEKIEHQLKINYENSAASKNWPGGDYLSWLRVYLPTETKIKSISIYNPKNPGSKEVISAEDREEKINYGKKVVGFQVKVPIQERRRVEINFNQEITNSDQNSFGYFLYWQKQSGYRNTPISLLVSFPENWEPMQVQPSANVVSGKLLFNKQLNKDLNFGIQFSQ